MPEDAPTPTLSLEAELQRQRGLRRLKEMDLLDIAGVRLDCPLGHTAEGDTLADIMGMENVKIGGMVQTVAEKAAASGGDTKAAVLSGLDMFTQRDEHGEIARAADVDASALALSGVAAQKKT